MALILSAEELVQATGDRPPDGLAHSGRWLHVVPHLDAAYGGISAVVPQLVRALRETRSCDAEIAAFCAAREEVVSLPDGIPLTRWPLSRVAWVRDRSLHRRFRALLERADGLHIHGLWEQSTLVAARMARDLGKPYVLSAHGMLDPWAVGNRRFKKLLYAAVVERRNVRRAACLHALTAAEAGDYRGFVGGSIRPPIVIIPNGLTLPAEPSAASFLERFPQLRGHRLILFLGRIHPKKGIDVLVRAWARLAEQSPDAHLVIAGPDFEGTRARIESLVAQLGVASRVTFTGMLRDELKASALAAAAVFVLPSLSEGFSMSVLEAMGTGLPVIVTAECHIPEVAEASAGWTTQSEVAPLASSLQEFLSNPEASNRLLGDRGRELVRRRFAWPVIAREMVAQYGALRSATELSQTMSAKAKGKT